MTSLITSAKPFILGVDTGLAINSLKADEDAFRAGQHHVYTTLCQASEVRYSLNLVEQVVQAGLSSTFSIHWGYHIVSFVVTAGIAYLASSNIENPLARRCIYLLHDNVGTLAQVASVVSCIALIVFEQYLFAASLGVSLVVGALCQYGILPEKARLIVHYTSKVFMHISNIFILGGLNAVLSTIDLVLMAVNRLAPYLMSNVEFQEYEQVPRETITYNESLNLTTRQVTVNRAHVYEPCAPPTPDVELEQLKEFGDQINWNEHLAVLSAKLEDDDRWTERYAGPRTGEGKIAYLKQGLATLVDRIENRQILAGQPNSYTSLVNNLKQIIAIFPQLSTKEQANLLIPLGVEGVYCGPGLFRIVEETTQSFLFNSNEITVEQRIRLILQQKRMAVFQSFYHRAYVVNQERNPMIEVLRRTHLFDFQNTHNYNLIVNIFNLNRRFGLNWESAEQDRTAELHPLERLYYDKLFNYGQLYTYFWENYNQAIDETVEGCMGTPQLPTPEITNWFCEWYDREVAASRANEDDKIDFITGLFHNNSSTLKPEYMRLMLLEMGIYTTRDNPHHESLLDDVTWPAGS